MSSSTLDKKLVLGITGGIATGKTTVAKLFADRGAFSISADNIARDLLASGSPLAIRVIDEFGPEYALVESPDTIDRAKLAKLIFADSSARNRLNSLTHPAIHQQLQTEIDSARQASVATMIVVEIPLLFENHLEHMVDKILVVTCSRETQISRLLQRHTYLTRPEAESQIDSQLPLSDKITLADYTIDSDQSIDEAVLEIQNLFLI